jgi:uncharacterized membrane protein YfcA
MDLQTLLLAAGSGGLIGLVLSLIGGGGSILAVPLLVYVVGVASPHEAIGTAAVAVAANAAVGLMGHWRAGRVKWRCAWAFGVAGVVGATVGAAVGKAVDGQHLLALFGVLMIAVGLAMMARGARPGLADVRLTRASAGRLLPRLFGIGLGVGLMAGFFGIGGGFLIVPGLMLATGMNIASAIGTSLFVVTALGLTTSASYAVSGLVDWGMTAAMIGGGAGGILLGLRLGRLAQGRKALLERGFAGVVILVGLYVAGRGLMALS